MRHARRDTRAADDVPWRGCDRACDVEGVLKKTTPRFPLETRRRRESEEEKTKSEKRKAGNGEAEMKSCGDGRLLLDRAIRRLGR
jgi:hypothetical protein